MFVDFMTEPGDGVLVVEDADTMLTTRRRGENRMVSRFLNISDGVIKFKNKKIVFTTNLEDFKEVDEAVLRPGRCFRVLHCRPLTVREGRAAAQVIGRPPPTGECTLAELFTSRTTPDLGKVVAGFGVRR